MLQHPGIGQSAVSIGTVVFAKDGGGEGRTDWETQMLRPVKRPGTMPVMDS